METDVKEVNQTEVVDSNTQKVKNTEDYRRVRKIVEASLKFGSRNIKTKGDSYPVLNKTKKFLDNRAKAKRAKLARKANRK